eukprot:TRINITY_DN1191_c0_g1_i2.p1 TRINITY_DN1191_c0_g1~~TRINITY_DN1191_c0_g1_i2.p1  ORF type:complete len:209 (+),score=46.99 TRINITY_DN1191_c0_g1_i2:85-711(+)
MRMIYIFLFLSVLCSFSLAQSVSDPCISYTNKTGVIEGTFITEDETVPVCWRIVPNIGASYVPQNISIYFSNFNYSGECALTIYQGSTTNSPQFGTFTGTDNPTAGGPVQILSGELLLVVNCVDQEVSMTLDYQTSEKTKLKTALVVLVCAVIMFTIPGVMLCATFCACRSKEEKKIVNATSREIVAFWAGLALAGIISILMLARKAV